MREHDLETSRSRRFIRIPLAEKPVEPLKAEPKYNSTRPRYGILEMGTSPRRRVAVVLDEAEGKNRGECTSIGITTRT